jgi:hypothetical protein
MITVVSPKFRELIMNKYPALQGNEPWLRFFHYICFSGFFDPESHRLVIPTKMIAEKIFGETYTTTFNGRDKLQQFRDQVLPGLTWTEHTQFSPASYRGKAREVLSLGFDAEMQAALRQECLSPSEEKIDLITGHPYHRKDRYRLTEQETAAYQQELTQYTLNPTQKSILEYLHGISAGHLFLRKLTDNAGAIEQAIQGLPQELQTIRYRILKKVRENPSVYYLPSSEERTCRLSARGDCILGLKKAVRKAATKGWVECDLRSSQFAILAGKLGAPISQAFIASGESIWREFYRHTHAVDADPPTEVKKVFKEAIYSLCFGKGEGNLKQFLHQNEVGSLAKHPIMAELLTLRQKWFDQIDRDGGASDVWGQWQALDNALDPATGKGKRWAGSVAAAVIQSVEMEIIAPIFEVAREHGRSDQFTICLFQHDGSTISFQSAEKKTRAQGKLKAAVEDRAKRLGVSTVLEFQQL